MGTPATTISRGVWVGGIEIDFDGADLRQSQSTVFAPFGVPVTAGLEAEQNSVGFVVGGSV
jgi:hypothetical protein